MQSQQLHDDECWEEDMDWERVEFDIDEIPVDYKGEQPPDIPPEDLEQLDGEAMKAEVDKLSKLGVVRKSKIPMRSLLTCVKCLTGENATETGREDVGLLREISKQVLPMRRRPVLHQHMVSFDFS